MRRNTEQDKTELLHNIGAMPEMFYNQLNGKSAQENYADWRNKHNQEMFDDYYDDNGPLDMRISSEVKVK